MDDTAVSGVAAVTLVTDDTNPPPPTRGRGGDSVKSAEKSGLGVDYVLPTYLIVTKQLFCTRKPLGSSKAA